MTRRRRVLRLVLALAFVATGAVLPMAPASAANVIVSPDTAGNVGQHSSLVLDAAGNPVVAYYDVGNGDLKVLRCGDPSCANPSTNVISRPDSSGNVGLYPSLVLDGIGNPMVAYYDATRGDLRFLHCYDPSCSDDETNVISVVFDLPQIDEGLYPSLALTSAGLPAIAFYVATLPSLNVAFCTDVDCAGPASGLGLHNGIEIEDLSMVLEAGDLPVVAYRGASASQAALHLARCGNPSCSFFSLTVVDNDFRTGSGVSLRLDASGFPVISYGTQFNTWLNLVHCYTLFCSPLEDNVRSIVDEGGAAFATETSMVLNSAGNPVIAYRTSGNSRLKVVTCNDPNCAGGDEKFAVPDLGSSEVGEWPSLALDGFGNPVVSYRDITMGDLKVLHCVTANCLDEVPPVTAIELDPPEPTGNAGWYITPVGLDIASTDDNSGVAQTRCVADPVTPPSTYNDLPAGQCSLTSVGSDGEHQVYAASIDREGNMSVVASRTFRIDRTPPITALSRFPANPTGLGDWYWEPVTILLGGDDIPPGSGIAETRCALDPPVAPADFRDLPGPCSTVPVSTEGRHTLYAASDDVAGNFDALTVNTFGIDMTPPSAAVTLVPPAPDGENGWYVSPVQVGVTGTDNASGIGQVRCALDPSPTPGSVQDLPPPPCFMGAVGTDGEHRYFGGTMDGAGHFSVLASAEFKVDRTFPQSFASLTPFQPDGDNGWYRSPVVVSMFVDDGSAELRCALDPASPPGGFGDLPGPPCSVRLVLDDGDHALYWAAKDPAGNAETMRQTAFRIDTTAPTTGITLDPPQPDGANNWYVSPVTVTVGGISDDIVETRCVLNPPTQPLSFTDLPDAPCDSAVVEAEGSHVVYAASRDEAGNTEAPVARTFQIQRTTPMTTVSFDPPEPDGDNGWYSSDVAVVVSGPDGAEVRCAVNPDPAPRSFDDLPDEACFLLDPEDPAAIARAGWITIGRVGPLSLEDGVNVLWVASRHPSGISEDPISLTIRIDRQVPTLVVTVEPDEIVVGGTAEVNIEASDASSGIAESGCDPLDTTGVGEKTINCTATDYAGHTVTVTVTYVVVAGPDDPPDGSTTTTTTDPGGTTTTTSSTTSTTIAGGGGGDDLPQSGIESSRLVVLAFTWLMVGATLVNLARTRRLRWPAGRS